LRYLEIVFFDVDGVITEEKSSWRVVHRELGVLREAEKYKKAFEEGKISYEEWMRLDTELWIKASGGRIHRKDLERILSKVKIRKGFDELFVWLHKNNVKVALVSCGVELLVNRIGWTLGADMWISPRLRFDKRGYLLPGGIPIPSPRGNRSKGWAVKRIAWQLGVSLDKAAFVGDDYSDLDAFKVVKYPIAFNPDNPLVKDQALCTVSGVEDLKKVLEEIMLYGRCKEGLS
jgi:phosphoserine phosphatase